MSISTIPPVAEPADAAGSDAVRRRAVVQAIRAHRRRAAVGTIAARCSDRVITRTWL